MQCFVVVVVVGFWFSFLFFFFKGFFFSLTSFPDCKGKDEIEIIKPVVPVKCPIEICQHTTIRGQQASANSTDIWSKKSESVTQHCD